MSPEITVRELRRWRRRTWELTKYCSRQKTDGWYARDCLEAGVAKSKRCPVCKLLGEMDAMIEGARS